VQPPLPARPLVTMEVLRPYCTASFFLDAVARPVGGRHLPQGALVHQCSLRPATPSRAAPQRYFSFPTLWHGSPLRSSDKLSAPVFSPNEHSRCPIFLRVTVAVRAAIWMYPTSCVCARYVHMFYLAQYMYLDVGNTHMNARYCALPFDSNIWMIHG
jgi:hypothetical protein